MPPTVSVGSVTIVALSDTEQAYPANGVYPEADAAALAPYGDLLNADGAIILNFGCYLIRADGRTVLVDTGWGPTYDGKLLEELAAAGVTLDAIDVVIFTHLHGDHIGWNMVDGKGGPRPRFGQARYLVPEADWRHYSAQPEPSALFTSQVLPLAELGVMDLVNDGHVLSPSVVVVGTPGHTPGHLSVAINSGGEHGFILGDVAITPAEAQETDWPNRFDWEREIARRTRHTVLDRLEADGSVVAASHFPKPGLGRFVRRDGRRLWRPLE
jgi:glyoxylase-like metal-dependent hydrolase (beta-lactamase superfamily II)